jgi:transketolase
MRKKFVDLVTAEMKLNPNIWVLLGDVGYGVWDEARRLFPDRVLNMGAAEQSMMGVAVGLAAAGKIPVVYTITPFLLYRPFETVRNYLHHEQVPVKLVGSGRGRDYAKHGFSHWAEEDADVMKVLSNINPYWPNSEAEMEKIFAEFINQPCPAYLNLCR